MNKKVNGASKYFGDPRYEKVWEKMKLLGIDDVSTRRQSNNGTITWRLPIKNQWNGGSCIEVGSFKSGYVRNNNSCSTNYQLNKRPQYFKDCEWNDNFTKQTWTGKYKMYTTRECVLIPIEIERLEYLISYCLKNFYIKYANLIPNGDYIHKNQYKWELERVKRKLEDREAESLNDCGHYDKIRELESDVRGLESKYQASQKDLDDMTQERDCARLHELEDSLESSDYRIQDLERMLEGYKTREKDLGNKLDTIKRIAEDE